MNAHYAFALVVAAAGAAAAINARADDITIDPNPFVSTATRAQVNEELRQFRASGVNPWADDYNPMLVAQSTKSRSEVRAEYMADRAEVAAMTGEDSGSTYFMRVARAAHRNGTDLARAE